MIPELEKPKFLPLFQDCMYRSLVNTAEKMPFIEHKEPIECQVLSTHPKFVLSDGHHKVTCAIGEDAVLSLKKYHPTIRVKDLDKHVITLLKYAPHTYLDPNGSISPTLHIYDVQLRSPEKQKNNSVFGKPKELAAAEDMKATARYESSKLLRRFITGKKDVNNLPPLENYLLRRGEADSKSLPKRIIKYESKRGTMDDLGKCIIETSEIELVEDDLTKKAAEDLAKEKERKRKEKEHGREVASLRREKPIPLGKALNKFVDDWKIKQEKEKDKKPKKPEVPNFIKEGVASILSRKSGEAPQLAVPTTLRSTSKVSVSKGTNSQRPSVIKGKANASAVKLTAKGFKNFLSWRAGAGNIDPEATNVADVLKRSKAGPMKVDFAAPAKPTRKAFEGWASAVTPSKKRSMPEEEPQSRKSTVKKPKSN